jgi:hypothetical protein
VALDDGSDDLADIADGSFAIWLFEVDRLGIVTSKIGSVATTYAGESSRDGAQFTLPAVTAGSLAVGALILQGALNSFVPDTGQIGANSDSDNERFYNFVGSFGVITPLITIGAAADIFTDSQTGSSGLPQDFDYPAAEMNLLGQAQAIATADDAGFTVADTINSGSLAGLFFGGWLVVFDAGNVDTAAPAIFTVAAPGFSASAQNMLFASSNDVKSALDAIVLPRGLVELGRIVVGTVSAKNFLANDGTEGELRVDAADGNIASVEFIAAAVPASVSTVNA